MILIKFKKIYIITNNMKTITFALQKGGVGKTSLSVSVAVELAKSYSVVFIDTDPQGNATSWLLNNTEINSELVDCLKGKVDYKKCLYKTPINRLAIIPTASLDSGLRDYEKNEANSRPYAMSDLIEQIQGDFDYCIIDTPPSYDALTTSAFIASDEIVSVIKADDFSKDGLQIFNELFAETRKNYRIPDDKGKQKTVVLNCYSKVRRADKMYLAFYQKLRDMGYNLFLVPNDTAFINAQIEHIPVQEMARVKKDTIETLNQIAKEVAK